jgi:hypothetical protein
MSATTLTGLLLLSILVGVAATVYARRACQIATKILEKLEK